MQALAIFTHIERSHGCYIVQFWADKNETRLISAIFFSYLSQLINCTRAQMSFQFKSSAKLRLLHSLRINWPEKLYQFAQTIFCGRVASLGKWCHNCAQPSLSCYLAWMIADKKRLGTNILFQLITGLSDCSGQNSFNAECDFFNGLSASLCPRREW